VTLVKPITSENLEDFYNVYLYEKEDKIKGVIEGFS